jgi:UDP-N-acetylglucosamine 1-carboxyvinyltransferase
VARIENDVKGCSLGAREIDPHIDVFERFGGKIERSSDALVIRADAGLHASQHWMDYASVTTTENFVLCAALANGSSTMMNAASEPHVQEFCQFMQQLGAHIEGVGTSSLKVHGVERLGGADFTFAEDFHEIVTFLALGAITGGEVVVKNSTPEQFPLLDRTFAKFGVHIEHQHGWSRNVLDGPLRVREPFTANILQKVEAAPWPYVPVDLLPIFITLGVRAEGQCMFWNKIYDGAMGWTAELSRFGAHAFLADPHRIITFGGKPLQPASVESPYIIRAAIAMLMLACSIPGQSRIRKAAPIKRAHPHFAENITALGAQVDWVEAE